MRPGERDSAEAERSQAELTTLDPDIPNLERDLLLRVSHATPVLRALIRGGAADRSREYARPIADSWILLWKDVMFVQRIQPASEIVCREQRIPSTRDERLRLDIEGLA